MSRKYNIETEEGVEQMDKEQVIRFLKKEHGIKPDEAKTVFDVAASDGKYELDLSDCDDADKKKALTAAFKATEKLLKRSAEITEEQEKAKEDAKKQEAKHGEMIVAASQKGIKLAKAGGASEMTENLSKLMAKGVNANIQVTETGLSLKKGAKITEVELTTAIAGLCGLSEETAKFRTIVGWNLGDAALLAEQFDGGVDRIVAQAIKERGISKHTVMQAIKLCREFPHEDRIAGLSVTHHQELMNYKGSIKDPKKFKAIVKELKDGATADVVPSCAELRTVLQEASGKKPKASKPGKNGSAKEERACTANYLYIMGSGAPDECFVHENLSESTLDDDGITVIDLNSLSVLGKKGQPISVLKDLDADYFPPTEDEEEVKPKGKKSKAKADAEAEEVPM